jgi:FKBP-type peptidyl-prolyl cis-trans isomerase
VKKLLVIFCLALCAAAAHAKAIQEDVRKAEQQAQVSYAFGMILGNDLRSYGIEKMDYAAFAEGLKAAVENASPQFSENEAMEIVQAALQKAADQKNEENRAKEARYLAENAARPEVRSTPSGLQYEVISEGSGSKPAATDTVRVNYEGRLTDGTVFDSSYNDGESVEIPLNRVIPGWTEGITLMNVGSICRLYIPSELAYGERGAGQVIPPYSTLVFTVELLGIVQPDPDSADAGNTAPAE